MPEITLLTVLKASALLIALATTMWGMLSKPTVEDAQGRKRLTPAGHVAALLAFGGFLIALATHGYEALAKQAGETAAAQEKFIQEQRNQRRHDQIRRSQAEQIAIDKANAAEARARDLLALSVANSHKLLTLAAESEQRVRDEAISRDVNISTRNNVRAAARILTQVQRAANPIGMPYLVFAVDIPVANIPPAMLKELRDHYPECLSCAYGEAHISKEKARESGLGALYNILRGIRIHLSLINRAASTQRGATLDFASDPIAGDLSVSMPPDQAVVHYDAEGEPLRVTIVFGFDAKSENPTTWAKTEMMASTNDLLTAEGAVLLVKEFPAAEISWAIENAARAMLSVESAGRRFEGRTPAPLVDGHHRRFVMALKETERALRFSGAGAQ